VRISRTILQFANPNMYHLPLARESHQRDM
jgi:hypothetical protein